MRRHGGAADRKSGDDCNGGTEPGEPSASPGENLVDGIAVVRWYRHCHSDRRPAGMGPPAVTLYVASGGSGDCTSQGAACSSLATALATATGVAYSGDDVTIDVGVGTFDENDIVDAAGLNSLTIAGTGASSTVLDGTDTGNVLVIAGGTVNVSGVTIENGNNGDDGAGIDSCDAEVGCVVTVSDSTFSDNNAPAWGGAIDNGDNGGNGTLTVTDSTFTDDTSAGNGGGAINNGANGGGGTVTVSGSTFTGDSAVASGRGGAINNADNSGSGTVTVSGSTFTGDTADWGGGAIANGSDQGDGSVSVTNSTFSSNGASLESTRKVAAAPSTTAKVQRPSRIRLFRTTRRTTAGP